MPVKSSTAGFLSKCSFQCASQILIRNSEHSNFQNDTFEKNTITVMEDAPIQISFPDVGSKQKNKNEHTEYHDDIFILFKSQVYSKHGSPTFLLFGSWSLVSYIHVSVNAKFFLITLI